jgi:NADH dehydrogenase
MKIPTSNNSSVVIIGSGLAGIAIKKILRNKNLQVVLLDKHNYQTFQPFSYKAATIGRNLVMKYKL